MQTRPALLQGYFKDYLDPFFEKLEYAVFGFQPVIAFANAFRKLVAVSMHTRVFSYDAIIRDLAVLLYVKSDRTRFKYYVLRATDFTYAT